ncbi:universal stress protein [Streptomyces sp. S.PB5]|uniref:universal stress protein n=1 Tax=Streptomyces sp. S.PB5 TaxID=3020844 RepID=UPI0025B10AD4|nr:universal stress protein [Streptomyces sp. S.PB5]MDN3028455.1 universal stress protein [Streptomyces sp. S.PB5]
MPRPVTAGIDGSAASLAAAAWAAREAELRDTALHLVAAWPPPDGASPETADEAERRHFAARSLDLARDRLRGRHPHLDIQARLLGLPPHVALLASGLAADLLVLGSRGLGGISALLLGSTGVHTAALADFPVALVRPLPHPGDLPAGPVLLALDAEHPAQEAVITLAFEEAAMREVPLRALYAWTPTGPALRTYPITSRPYGPSPRARHAERRLTEVLMPWRQKFPEVRVEEVCLEDIPAGAVTAATRHAALAVLGHRVQPAAGPRLGPVAHATVRAAACPVLLVPHA